MALDWQSKIIKWGKCDVVDVQFFHLWVRIITITQLQNNEPEHFLRQQLMFKFNYPRQNKVLNISF